MNEIIVSLLLFPILLLIILSYFSFIYYFLINKLIVTISVVVRCKSTFQSRIFYIKGC